MIMIFSFFVFVGLLIDYINNIVIKLTIENFLKTKSKKVFYISLLLRITFLLIIFILIAKFNIKYLYAVFIGLIISKFYLLITRSLKNGNNNR